MNSQNGLPMKDLEIFGVFKNGKFTIPEKEINALKNGRMTDVVELTDLKGHDIHIEKVSARLSIEKGENGKPTLMINPVYKTPNNHPLLSDKEKKDLVENKVQNHTKTVSIYGSIVSHGKDNFEFDPKGRQNYFIEIQKDNGERKHIWGVDLERALQESGHKIGDRVQLTNLGYEMVNVEVPIKDRDGEIIRSEWKSVNRNKWEVADAKDRNADRQNKDMVIEYDQKTKQFYYYDPNSIKTPERVNDEQLSEQQKKKYKKGDVVKLADGTEFQFSPSSAKGLRSNRSALVLSVLLDGGISYLLVTGVSKMLGKNKIDENAYSQGFRDAIKKVEKEVERRIARNPNDKDAVRDLNNIKEEYSKIAADSTLPKNVRDDFDINKIKRLNSFDTEEGKNPRKRFEQDNGFDRDI